MNTIKFYLSMFLCTLVALSLTSCSDDDDVIAPFTVNFGTAELGISATTTSAEATLQFSRPATVNGSLSVTLQTGSLNYGEEADFHTSIVPVDNTITIPFSSGDQSVSLTIFAGSAFALQQDETLVIEIIDDASSVFTPGQSAQLSVIFSENFISTGASLVTDVTAEFDSRSYIDLSKASTELFDRGNYDLGFYSGNGFYVTLNASAAVMARPLDKNDLNSVTAADTLGFAAVMTIPPANFQPNGSVAWVDTPDGNLQTTAFGEISATDSENAVFIIKRDNGDWKKVRVLRNTGGYSLRHADIGATSFETLEITKDGTFEEIAVHLDQGIVAATPENSRWDLMYGSYTEILGGSLPYSFDDYIITNRSDVSIITVMTGDFTYEEFSASDVNNEGFLTEINAIGSTWRQGGGPGSPPALFTDRFFVIQDGESNTYKLKFTGMFSAEGERGELSFAYELLN